MNNLQKQARQSFLQRPSARARPIARHTNDRVLATSRTRQEVLSCRRRRSRCYAIFHLEIFSSQFDDGDTQRKKENARKKVARARRLVRETTRPTDATDREAKRAKRAAGLFLETRLRPETLAAAAAR